jgi:hypothetical protein
VQKCINLYSAFSDENNDIQRVNIVNIKLLCQMHDEQYCFDGVRQCAVMSNHRYDFLVTVGSKKTKY